MHSICSVPLLVSHKMGAMHGNEETAPILKFTARVYLVKVGVGIRGGARKEYQN